MKEYKNLDHRDEEKIEEFSEACNELSKLEVRCNYLKEVIRENQNLQKFTWRTRMGQTIPVSKMEDEHLRNTVSFLMREGKIHTYVFQEYQNRFNETLQIPEPEEDENFDF